jgi:hypothetical protein
MPTNELTRVLEDLVEANSLWDVLQALADITHERSLNEPDAQKATRWHKADSIVRKAADRVGDL